MTETLWVVGGEQRGFSTWTREWQLYKRALVLKVEDGKVSKAFDYVSPPEHCAEGLPCILFKAATIAGDRAYLCTQTEILICDFPSFALRQVISRPYFNDLHHVTVAPDGRLFVAVTGLDAVAELAPDGTLLRLVSVTDTPVWDRFSRTLDYRKVATTKPHRSHPNYVFFVDGEAWVTRFERRDAVPLEGKSGRRASFQLGNEPVHDGCVLGKQVYFTAVNGVVMRIVLDSGDIRSFDLVTMTGADRGRSLSWCRGILPGDESTWVGFSRIRFTALRHNLDWARRGFRDIDWHTPAPTRIAEYDFDNCRLLRTVDLEEAGMHTVFSIHRA